MVDWNSPEQSFKDAVIYVKVVHAFIGLYFWEFLTSLDLEWMYLTGRRKFRWPMLLYYAGRYLILGYCIAFILVVDVIEPLDCDALMQFLSFSAAASVGFASLTLALRAVAVYAGTRSVKFAIILLSLGQWALILQSGLVKATFIPGAGCLIVKSDTVVGITTMLYSAVYDGIVAALVICRLAFPRTKTPLVEKLWIDGVYYFIAVFLTSTLASVMLLVNLSPAMDAIFIVPGAIFTTIAANRAVRRLTNFYGPTSDNHVRFAGNSLLFRSETQRTAPRIRVSQEVNVNMENDEQSSKSSHGILDEGRSYPPVPMKTTTRLESDEHSV